MTEVIARPSFDPKSLYPELESRGKVQWAPFPGFQTDVLRATEFDLFIGGSKGPGKSDLIQIGATRQLNMPFYKALILRESFPELQEIMLRAHRRFSARGATWSGETKTFTFPGQDGPGGTITFGYITKVEDCGRYQGGEWAYIGVDELARQTDEQIVEELQKEIRCPNPDVITMFRGTGNPGDPGHAWIRRRYIVPTEKGKLVIHYDIDIPGMGVVRKSRRFMPGTVEDNPIYANDPQYMAVLHSLSERRKRQLLHGDWDEGEGLALEEMEKGIHMVPKFEVPDHWPKWGALDPGFQHPWVFGAYTVDEVGQVFKMDTLTGRKMYVPAIYNELVSRFPDIHHWEILLCGPDLYYVPRAQELDIPSRGEKFGDLGLGFTKWDASPRSRVISLDNLREWLMWRSRPGEVVGTVRDGVPGLRFMQTPGNEWCYDVLESMVLDPKNIEDALKVDANANGEGGDDAYDETRGAMSYRPFKAPDIGVAEPHRQRISKRIAQIMHERRQVEAGEHLEESDPDMDELFGKEDRGDTWEDAFG